MGMQLLTMNYAVCNIDNIFTKRQIQMYNN